VTLAKPANSSVSAIVWQRRAMIFLCALTATLPLTIRGNSCGHDFDFHVQSWLAVSQQWHQGTFYPNWIEAANFGAGEPRFVFYPPLSWMLGALLGIVLGWPAAPIAFTLIVLIACGVSMNKLAREWLPPNAATFAACAYILTPYSLFVAYERTAYGELAAGMWLPLIILYALRLQTTAGAPEPALSLPKGLDSETWVFAKEPAPPISTDTCHPERSADGAQSKDLRFERFLPSAIIPLALTIAAIWLTNAPAAVMACYSLAAITIWMAISRRQWQPLLNSTISLILGLGLASFYLVPAAYERRWVDIARAIGPGMRIQDSFLFGRTGESFHDQILRTASLIFVTMIVAIYILVGTTWKRKTAHGLLLPLSVTAAVLFALQLPWSDFIWRVAPELKFLQFPWRWTMVLSIVLALSLGMVAAARSKSSTSQRFHAHSIVVLIAAVALVSAGTWLFWQPCDEEDAVSAQVAVFRANNGFEGTDEYTPIGTDNSLIQQGLPKLRLLDAADAEVAVTNIKQNDGNPNYIPSDKDHLALEAKIERWLPEDKALTITAQTPGFAILRLMDYPSWHVRGNGTSVTNRTHRDDGLMTIPVQSGLTHIEIDYTATSDVWWGRSLTAASFLTLLALALASQKPRKVI
jgi:hypothetical protein